MEEDKAAAYYEELTRKGGGAARFKQGLGFSSSSENDAVQTKQYSSSSFLNNFVKASSPTTTSNLQKQAQLESIRNKLKKKPSEEQKSQSRARKDRDRGRDYKDRERDCREERDHRERERRDRERDRDGERETRRRRGRSKSASPRERREEKRRRRRRTPAERIKAKTKLQLAETAENDEMKGSGWERFEFNKDAPLDDEEIEVAEDDAAIVKRIGQSFRFSTIEAFYSSSAARREEQIKAAHDEAMFGASGVPPSVSSDREPEADISEIRNVDSDFATSLFREKVLAKQQGSWRDRARKE